MDSPDDAHSRALSTIVDTLRFRLLVRCMEAGGDCDEVLNASTAQLIDSFSDRIAEAEQHAADHKRHRTFTEHPEGLGPTIGMDVGSH